MLTQLHFHFGVKVGVLLGNESVVVLAKVARLVPKLVHFSTLALWNGPYTLSFTLVSFAVLLETLLNLALVQPPRAYPLGLLAWKLLRGLLREFGIFHRR